MSKVSLNDFPWKYDVELAHAFGVPLYLKFTPQGGIQTTVQGNFRIVDLITSVGTPESAEQRQAAARAAYREMDALRVEKEKALGHVRGEISKYKEKVLRRHIWLGQLISAEMNTSGKGSPAKESTAPVTSGTSGVFRVPAAYDTADIWFGRRHTELDAWIVNHRGALDKTPGWIVALTQRDGVAGEQARELFGDSLRGVEGKIQPLLREEQKENGKVVGYAIRTVFDLILRPEFAADPSFRPNRQHSEVMSWMNTKGAALVDTPAGVAELTQLPGKTGERARALYGDVNTKRPGFLQISAVQARLTPKPRMNPRRNPEGSDEVSGDEAYIVKAEYSVPLRDMNNETIEKIKQKIRDTFPAEAEAKIEFFDSVLAAQKPAAGSQLSVLNAQEESAQKEVNQITEKLNKMSSTSRLAAMEIKEEAVAVRFGPGGPTYKFVTGPSRWAIAAQRESDLRKGERRAQKIALTDVFGMRVKNIEGDVYDIIFKNTNDLSVSVPPVAERLRIQVSPELQPYFNFLGALGINLNSSAQKAITSRTAGDDPTAAEREAAATKKPITLQVMTKDSGARSGWNRDKNKFIFVLDNEYPPLAKILAGQGGKNYELQVKAFLRAVSSPSDVIVHIEMDDPRSLERAMLPVSALLMRTAGVGAQVKQTTQPIEDWSMIVGSQIVGSREKNTEVSLVMLRDFSEEAKDIFTRGATVLLKVNAALADIQENEVILPFVADKTEIQIAINIKRKEINSLTAELSALGLNTNEYRPLLMNSRISFSHYLPLPTEGQLASILTTALRQRLPSPGTMIVTGESLLPSGKIDAYANEILSHMSWSIGADKISLLTKKAMSYYVKNYEAGPTEQEVQRILVDTNRKVDMFNTGDEDLGVDSAKETMENIEERRASLRQEVMLSIENKRRQISLLQKDPPTDETQKEIKRIEGLIAAEFSRVLSVRNKVRRMAQSTTALAFTVSQATISVLPLMTHNIFWRYSATVQGSPQINVRKLIRPQNEQPSSEQQHELPGIEQEGRASAFELPEEGELMFYLLSFPAPGGKLSSPDKMMNPIFDPASDEMLFEYEDRADAHSYIANIVSVLQEAETGGIPVRPISMAQTIQNDKTFAALMQLSGPVWTGKVKDDKEDQFGFFEKKSEVFARMIRTWDEMEKDIKETATRRLPQIALAGDYANIPGTTEIYAFIVVTDSSTGKETTYRLDTKYKKSRRGYNLIPVSNTNRLVDFFLKHPEWLAPPFAKVTYRTSEDAYYSEASASPVGGRQDPAAVAEAAARKAARKAGASRSTVSSLDVEIDLSLIDMPYEGEEEEAATFGPVGAGSVFGAGATASDAERAEVEARAKRTARAELGELLPFPVSNMMHFDKNITFRTADGRIVDRSLATVLKGLNDPDDRMRAKKLARLWLVRAGDLLAKNQITWEELSLVYGHSSSQSMIPFVATLFDIPRPARRDAFIAAAKRERENIDRSTSAAPPTDAEVAAKAERDAKAAERRGKGGGQKSSGTTKRKKSLLASDIDIDFNFN